MLSEGTSLASGILIKLTGVTVLNGLMAYAWVEVEESTDPGNPAGVLVTEKVGGLVGTINGVNGATATSLPAYESSGHGPLPVSNTAGLIRTVVRAYYGAGEGYLIFGASPEVEMVLCNSDAPDANGCYDGILQLYDPVARTWTNVQTGVCLVDGSGGTTNTFSGSFQNGQGASVSVTRGLVTSTSTPLIGGNVFHAGPSDPSTPASPSYRAIVYRDLPRTFYSSTAEIAVANTVTETSLLNGTPTFVAETFSQAGRGFKVSLRGHWSSDAVAAGTARVRVKLGTTVIADTGTFTVPNGLAGEQWSLDLDAVFFSVGSSGVVQAMGWLRFYHSASDAMRCAPVADQSATVSTTASRQLNITFQWGTADSDNSITVGPATVELLP